MIEYRGFMKCRLFGFFKMLVDSKLIIHHQPFQRGRRLAPRLGISPAIKTPVQARGKVE